MSSSILVVHGQAAVRNEVRECLERAGVVTFEEAPGVDYALSLQWDF